MKTKWDRQYQKGEGLRWWPESELVKFLGRVYDTTWKPIQVSRGKALDLGCGTGRHMWALKEAGFDPYGMDVSEEAMELAGAYLHRRGVEQAMIVAAPLPQILYADGIFDLVVDCQTIQHLTPEEHVHAYLEVERVLKSGGKFWSMHWREGDAAELYGGQYPELHRTWALTELGPLIEEGGLKCTDIVMVNRGRIPEGLIASWYVMEWTKA